MIIKEDQKWKFYKVKFIGQERVVYCVHKQPLLIALAQTLVVNEQCSTAPRLR